MTPTDVALARIEGKIDALIKMVAGAKEKETRAMSQIDDALSKLQADLTAETNASTAIESLLTSVNQQLQAALALGDPTKIAAEVSSISSALETNTAALVAATVANTPAANPPAPPPAPPAGS